MYLRVNIQIEANCANSTACTCICYTFYTYLRQKRFRRLSITGRVCKLVTELLIYAQYCMHFAAQHIYSIAKAKQNRPDLSSNARHKQLGEPGRSVAAVETVDVCDCSRHTTLC